MLPWTLEQGRQTTTGMDTSLFQAPGRALFQPAHQTPKLSSACCLPIMVLTFHASVCMLNNSYVFLLSDLLPWTAVATTHHTRIMTTRNIVGVKHYGRQNNALTFRHNAAWRTLRGLCYHTMMGALQRFVVLRTTTYLIYCSALPLACPARGCARRTRQTLDGQTAGGRCRLLHSHNRTGASLASPLCLCRHDGWYFSACISPTLTGDALCRSGWRRTQQRVALCPPKRLGRHSAHGITSVRADVESRSKRHVRLLGRFNAARTARDSAVYLLAPNMCRHHRRGVKRLGAMFSLATASPSAHTDSRRRMAYLAAHDASSALGHIAGVPYHIPMAAQQRASVTCAACARRARHNAGSAAQRLALPLPSFARR